MIAKQSEVKRDPKGKLLPGHGLISPGRPVGSSIKDQVRKWLADHDDDRHDFVEHFVKENRELAWQMLEGRPQQDVTTGGKSFNSLKDLPNDELERIAEGSEEGIS